MLNKIFFFILFLFALNHKNKLYEGTMNSNEATICNFSVDRGASITDSNLKSFMFDSRCSTGYKYKIIKNCLGPRDKFGKDGDCELCDRGKYGTCRATYKGGYCDKNGTMKDARGVTIDDPGRELGEMDEEDLEDHNPEKYDSIIKNECNPFKTDERDYEDDDDDDEDDDDDDDEDDDLDKLYRRDRRRRGRRRRRNIRRNMRENNRTEDEGEYGIESDIDDRINNSNNRGNESDSIIEKIKENKIIVGAVVGISILILILSVVFKDKLKNITGKELKFLDSIHNAFKRNKNNNGGNANANVNANANANVNANANANVNANANANANPNN